MHQKCFSQNVTWQDKSNLKYLTISTPMQNKNKVHAHIVARRYEKSAIT